VSPEPEQVSELGRSVRMLVVEDDERMLTILTKHLDRMGFDVAAATNGSEALSLMSEDPAQIVLSDIRMPGMDGSTLLRVLRERFPATRVILMTAFGSVDAAVEAMKAGAYSYICKPFKVEEVALLLRNVAREIHLEEEVESLKETVRKPHRVEDLIGPSSALTEVRELTREAANVSATVLITGRSGTGKERVARAIHHASRRAAQPFIAVNCAAIPETLFESEMFGHRKGAFTGAHGNQVGLIEESHRGTLFLDEVGEFPLPQQAKLLRVLEDREVRPVGAARPVPVDLRVICATNCSLEAMVRQGEFREDLFYRINVLRIHIPELSKHREDIAPIAGSLLAELSQEHGVRCHGYTPEALEALEAYPWPGNVRELRNVVERAILKAVGRRIERDDLSISSPKKRESHEENVTPRGELNTRRSLAEVESRHIELVLAECEWNRSAASKVLGIDRRTLFTKIQKYGIIGPLQK